MKEKNIRELAKRMGLITVENMCQYTIAQLVVMVANKVNELINEVWRFETDVQEILKTQNENIQYLLGEGLHLEVASVFEGWMEDGTFDTLINQTALKKVNDRIDETNAQLSSIEKKIYEVNVASFGAKGDGITDDTNAIQNAIDSVKGVQAIVRFPPGVYRLESKFNDITDPSAYLRRQQDGIIIHNNLTLIGDRASFSCSDDLAYVFTQHNLNGPTVESVDNLIIEGFTFYKNAVSFKEERAWFSHINLEYGTNIQIKNCTFNGFSGDCIMLGFLWGGPNHDTFKASKMERILIENCTFNGINKGNRNAISVCTVDGIDIKHCKFMNMTASTMPGAIDFEPERDAIAGYEYSHTHKVMNVNISDNDFYNIGGNVGSVAFVLHNKMDEAPKNIVVENNKFIKVTRPFFVSGANGLESGLTNVNNIHFRNNVCSDTLHILSASNVFQCYIENNTFNRSKGSLIINQSDFGPGMTSSYVFIRNNTFNDTFTTYNNSACIELDQGIYSLVLVNNHFIDTIMKDSDGFKRFRVATIHKEDASNIIYKDNVLMCTKSTELSTVDTIDILAKESLTKKDTIFKGENVAIGINVVLSELDKCNRTDLPVKSELINQTNSYNAETLPNSIPIGISASSSSVNSQRSLLITFKPSPSESDRLNTIQLRFTSDGTNVIFTRFGTLDNKWTSWTTFTGA